MVVKDLVCHQDFFAKVANRLKTRGRLIEGLMICLFVAMNRSFSGSLVP